MTQVSCKYGIPMVLNGTQRSKDFLKKNIRITQEEIYQLAIEFYDLQEADQDGKIFSINNSITRQLQNTCHQLDELDRSVPTDNASRLMFPTKRHFMRCYQCHKLVRAPHSTYLFCCFKCGELNQKYRLYSLPLTGKNALITGGRTKLGHQIALKLLRSGCNTVVVTTRDIKAAEDIFSQYQDYTRWKDNLLLKELDLDSNHLDQTLDHFIGDLSALAKLDILINCAAQTIRARDKPSTVQKDNDIRSTPKNRYGDPKFVDNTHTNSWHVRLMDYQQYEAEECYRINSVAPALLIQKCIPLLIRSDSYPYIINVHAREGIFHTNKDDLHIQTNMAKASLHMLTKCLARKTDLRTHLGKRFAVHGCDPGWFSVDEYYENNRPWVVPPLDEVDGAARILFPLYSRLPGCSPTRRHFHQLTY